MDNSSTNNEKVARSDGIEMKIIKDIVDMTQRELCNTVIDETIPGGILSGIYLILYGYVCSGSIPANHYFSFNVIVNIESRSIMLSGKNGYTQRYLNLYYQEVNPNE